MSIKTVSKMSKVSESNPDVHMVKGMVKKHVLDWSETAKK